MNWYTDRTPEQWATEAANFRRMAAESARRANESYERCQEDGFLSQWASNSMSLFYRACAELCDAQGVQEREALFDLAGNLVSTRMINGQYGCAWLTTEEHVRAGGTQFVNPSKAKKGVVRYRNLKSKGYTVGTVAIRCGVFSRSDGPWPVYAAEPLHDTINITVIRTDNGIGENWD
jgi:hypothetical protein